MIHEHYSDSGEPSGTAGQPILNISEKNNLIQTGIFIIRYYSVTKLGKKGLIKAYSESAHNVIKSSNLLLWNDICFLQLSSPIRYFGIITRLIEKMSEEIIKKASSDGLVRIIQIDTSLVKILTQNIRISTVGKAKIEKIKLNDSV